MPATAPGSAARDVGRQGRHRRELGERHVGGQQSDERGRRPADVHGALEAGTGAGAALTDPDELGAVAAAARPARCRRSRSAGTTRCRTIAPRWTSRRRPRGRPAPTPRASRATSSTPSTSSPTPAARSWAVGTMTSNHTIAPGSSSTAPPPLRRRTTSTPAAAHADSSATSASRCVDPRTSAGAVDVEHPHRPAPGRRRCRGRGTRPPTRRTTGRRRHGVSRIRVRTRAPGTASTPRGRGSR